ncbi:hypothetical protein [Mycobacterium sp. shizuoka-1]|uniref:hypothetical protein n=1 Tax=Mycobacterium sp. shizuoka-1 TaxID=2039281 RepID=UPI001303F935|nr:hypothetical protein [Mycobacterium sp. shizuoka-1]
MIAAIVGAAAGYLIWLGATTIIVATVPTRYWVMSVAVLLAALAAGAFTMAVRYKGTAKAMAFWCAPALPILVSLYLLILVVT